MNSVNPRLFPPDLLIDDGNGFASMSFTVPEPFFFCDGHFPAAPLVPGAVLAAWMLEAARLAGLPPTGQQVKNLKFRLPVLPGGFVCLTAKATESGVRVSLRSDERLCADATFFP